KSCRQQPTQDLLTRETTSLWYCTAFQIRSASIPYPRTSCRMTGATWHHRFVTAPSPSTDQRGGAPNDVVPLHHPSGCVPKRCHRSGPRRANVPSSCVKAPPAGPCPPRPASTREGSRTSPSPPFSLKTLPSAAAEMSRPLDTSQRRKCSKPSSEQPPLIRYA